MDSRNVLSFRYGASLISTGTITPDPVPSAVRGQSKGTGAGCKVEVTPQLPLSHLGRY